MQSCLWCPHNAHSNGTSIILLHLQQLITRGPWRWHQLTFTHCSGLTLFKVMVISGLSSRTFSFVHVGSSLVQMLMGTIQLGQSSPATHKQVNNEKLPQLLDFLLYWLVSEIKETHTHAYHCVVHWHRTSSAISWGCDCPLAKNKISISLFQ